MRLQKLLFAILLARHMLPGELKRLFLQNTIIVSSSNVSYSTQRWIIQLSMPLSVMICFPLRQEWKMLIEFLHIKKVTIFVITLVPMLTKLHTSQSCREATQLYVCVYLHTYTHAYIHICIYVCIYVCITM